MLFGPSWSSSPALDNKSKKKKQKKKMKIMMALMADTAHRACGYAHRGVEQASSALRV